MAAHNFMKVSLLQALSVTHDCDIICLSETFLLRADHQVTKDGGGICLYYKEHLPITKRDDLCTLKERLVTGIIMGKKSFLRVYIDHQVKIKKNLRSFVLI